MRHLRTKIAALVMGLLSALIPSAAHAYPNPPPTCSGFPNTSVGFYTPTASNNSIGTEAHIQARTPGGWCSTSLQGQQINWSWVAIGSHDGQHGFAQIGLSQTKGEPNPYYFYAWSYDGHTVSGGVYGDQQYYGGALCGSHCWGPVNNGDVHDFWVGLNPITGRIQMGVDSITFVSIANPGCNGFMHLPALRKALDAVFAEGVTPIEYNKEDAA